ncbi:MAG: S-layer homology domain-containing protein [Candidatus Gastranaerophilales bacterium]|nr:S-layer homology domain-containing protein [Candidatus Gastranaerophilales bacterium]
MKKIISILFLLLCSASSSMAMEFSDVPHGFWAYREIDKLTDKGIISGYSNEIFAPQKYVTRAEYAVMIIKAIEQENILINDMYAFEDVEKSHWAWPSIIRAVDLDIIKSIDGYFYPNELVTRSEMITFLTNILKTEHISKQEAIVALQNAYIDFDDIPDWFKVTAGKAEAIGVIAKEPPREQYLDYDAYITRAQMAVFLYNLKEKLFDYIEEKRNIELSPKIGEGIVIENARTIDDVATIPVHTMLPITVLGQLSSEETKAGDMFQARFVNNIVNNEHHILISKDIILVGKILNVIKSKNFFRNGGLLFELSATNNDGNYTRILAAAEYDAKPVDAGKFRKAANKIVKGRDYIVKDGQVLYIRLYKPLKVNVVTGEILD